MPLGPDTPLSSKLAVLLKRRLEREGRTPSTRALAADTAATPGGKPVMTHQVVNDLLNGVKSDPKSSQLAGLARAFGSPVAYLLPGYNGLTSLSVYEEHQDAREALRLIHDLGEAGAAELLEAAREIRQRHGHSNLNVPEVPEPIPPAAEPPRPGRRRRLSFTEAAERAVSDLEGH
jgi:transcriptional regulator with XRE-family HTH domain